MRIWITTIVTIIVAVLWALGCEMLSPRMWATIPIAGMTFFVVWGLIGRDDEHRDAVVR